MRKLISVLIVVVICSACTGPLQTTESSVRKVKPQDEVSILALRAKDYQTELVHVKGLYANEDYSGSLYSYLADGLKQYTLVNTPSVNAPKEGYPVIIFGHGFHPEPAKYGVSKTGKVSRPGDYYRGIPESFAAHGFLVISPDYRGHNISQGSEFTKTSYLASSYYASDVLHVLAGLSGLEQVDLNRIYYLGHSMGGEVGLKVLLSTNKITAASLWAPVAASTDTQAVYYGQYYESKGAEHSNELSNDLRAKYTSKIDAIYESLPQKVSKYQVDPINYIGELDVPILIQHARGDESVPYAWGLDLFSRLKGAGKDVGLHTVESSNHLFQGDNKSEALNRDIEFFNSYK